MELFFIIYGALALVFFLVCSFLSIRDRYCYYAFLKRSAVGTSRLNEVLDYILDILGSLCLAIFWPIGIFVAREIF